MKLIRNLQVKEVLEDKELELLQTKQAGNVLEVIIKLLKHRLDSVQIPNPDKANWEIKRAIADGRFKELQWLHSNLTEE